MNGQNSYGNTALYIAVGKALDEAHGVVKGEPHLPSFCKLGTQADLTPVLGDR